MKKRKEQGNAGSAPEWPHIPKEDRDELNAAYDAWYSAYALTFQPHGTDITKEKTASAKKQRASCASL